MCLIRKSGRQNEDSSTNFLDNSLSDDYWSKSLRYNAWSRNFVDRVANKAKNDVLKNQTALEKKENLWCTSGVMTRARRRKVFPSLQVSSLLNPLSNLFPRYYIPPPPFFQNILYSFARTDVRSVELFYPPPLFFCLLDSPMVSPGSIHISHSVGRTKKNGKYVTGVRTNAFR